MKKIKIVIQEQQGYPEIPLENRPEILADMLRGRKLNYLTLEQIRFTYQFEVEEVINMLKMIKPTLPNLGI